MSVDKPGVRELDVRDVDGEPFGQIMTTLNQLGADETLLLINSFEPVPLYNVLDERGFAYEPEQITEDEWHVRIEQR